MKKRLKCAAAMLVIAVFVCGCSTDAGTPDGTEQEMQAAEEAQADTDNATESNTETGSLSGSSQENKIPATYEEYENLQFISDAGKTRSGKDIMPIPDNDAYKMIKDINAGFNVGNAFDATDCGVLENELDYESVWCGSRTTEEFIDSLKNEGYNLVRIPVSWHDHVNEDYLISPDWMARVTEVVDLCLGKDMYVILDSHHDIYQDYFYPDSVHRDNALAFIEIIWQQIAENFRDYSDRLMFECINEPRLKGTDLEWWFAYENDSIIDSYNVIMDAEQAFVDTVRETGGNNAERYLLVGGYCNTYYSVLSDNFSLPMDTADNKLVVSVHLYSPFDFTANEKGGSVFDDYGKRENEQAFTALYDGFVSRGIPVMITEYGCIDKKNPEDRLAYFEYMRELSDVYSIPLVVWDNNVVNDTDGPMAGSYGYIDRASGEVSFRDLVDAMTGK